jgi:hypothetical protein
MKPATGSADSKKKAPTSERVGVRFGTTQAGKVLKGMQDSTRQVFSKTMVIMAQVSKTAFAKFSGSVDAGFGKAQTLGQTALTALSGKTGFAALKGEAAKVVAPNDGPVGQPVTKGAAPAKGAVSAAAAPSTAPLALRGDVQATMPGAERSGASVTAPTISQEASAPASTSSSGVDAPGAQEARAAVVVQDVSQAHEGLLLHGPHLQAALRRAGAAGKTLSMVYQLGENPQGAEFVTIATDDTAMVTGPAVDIVLTDGGVDTAGNWVAQAGKGKIDGEEVVLEPDADGCVFVTDGENDVARSVTMWIAGAVPLRADIVAIRRFGPEDARPA